MKRNRGWGGVRPGSGPKPLPVAERRRRAVLLRLSDVELKAIVTAAEGAPLATWLRAMAMRAARRRPK